MKKIESLIDPKKDYNIGQLVKLGIFYWIKQHSAYRNLIMTDMNNKNLLRAKFEGSGYGRRVRIKGSDIIKNYKEICNDHIKENEGQGQSS